MATRLENIVFDARDPHELGYWWAEALGWVVHAETPQEVGVCEVLREDGTHPYPELVFVPVAEPERGRERVHLDLNSFSVDDQQATVARLLSIGATPADVGQAADARFVVLADPEGNHFCVLDPRPECAHLGSLAGITLAAHDAAALRDLWQVATGWQLTGDDGDHVTLTPPHGGADLEIITRPTMPQQTAKNRVHLDIRPSASDDQMEVVAQLMSLGARPVEVGQSDDRTSTWIVLADPEDNELCVLSPHD
ncbi:MAG: hypothetical protein JWM47_3687 [Acidimicrobiales bacterium]|nr:hypothetical protein [Acidimicrobiales bacterium]